MYGLFRDPLLEHAPIANSLFVEFVTVGDGLVALKTADGQYISQEPNQHSHFNLAPEAKAYETFAGPAGPGLLTVWTRPAEEDACYTYVCRQLPNC